MHKDVRDCNAMCLEKPFGEWQRAKKLTEEFDCSHRIDAEFASNIF